MIIDSFTGEYRFLSNFYPSPITYAGLAAATVEHAYQAAKAQSVEDVGHVLDARTPGETPRSDGRAARGLGGGQDPDDALPARREVRTGHSARVGVTQDRGGMARRGQPLGRRVLGRVLMAQRAWLEAGDTTRGAG